MGVKSGYRSYCILCVSLKWSVCFSLNSGVKMACCCLILCITLLPHNWLIGLTHDLQFKCYITDPLIKTGLNKLDGHRSSLDIHFATHIRVCTHWYLSASLVHVIFKGSLMAVSHSWM